MIDRHYRDVLDNTEKTWWLGTDVLTEPLLGEYSPDVLRMSTRVEYLNEAGVAGWFTPGATYEHKDWYGAIFNVEHCLGEHDFDDDEGNSRKAPRCIVDGYSYHFYELMLEAQRRGYTWVAFDRDIGTLYRADRPGFRSGFRSFFRNIL